MTRTFLRTLTLGAMLCGVLGGTIALSAAPALAETISKTEAMVLKVGTPAPEFAIKDIKGQEYRLADQLRKKPVLMFFWSIFCGPCREEMPVLQRAFEKYGKDKLEFIGINIDGKITKAIEKVTAEYGFLTLMDELDGMSLKVSDPYGVVATPIMYIIDREGKISFVGVGKTDESAILEALARTVS
jgi:peroxiredoxin